MIECQSPSTIVQSHFSLKSWIQRVPSVQEARPAHCPRCQQVSRPVGAALKLHGHGLRERQVRGPVEPGQEPELLVLKVRRYRCCACQGTLTVVPQGVLGRRLFSAAALGLALCLWAVVGLGAAAVRAQVNPLVHVGATAAAGWGQLRRWAQAVRTGRLFPRQIPGPLPQKARVLAQRLCLALSALCPPQRFEQSLTLQVFEGAALAG